jgi:hypothetical protein
LKKSSKSPEKKGGDESEMKERGKGERGKGKGDELKRD